jgi:hypothetical protein
MAAKHTPGPWTVQPYGDGDSLVIHSDGNTRVCFMATPGDSPRAFPKIEANARLIAAAPDLLDVAWSVGFLVSVIKSGEPYTADVRRVAERATDAIAKATARPPHPPQSPGDIARDDHNPTPTGEQA